MFAISKITRRHPAIGDLFVDSRLCAQLVPVLQDASVVICNRQAGLATSSGVIKSHRKRLQRPCSARQGLALQVQVDGLVKLECPSMPQLKSTLGECCHILHPCWHLQMGTPTYCAERFQFDSPFVATGPRTLGGYVCTFRVPQHCKTSGACRCTCLPGDTCTAQVASQFTRSLQRRAESIACMQSCTSEIAWRLCCSEFAKPRLADQISTDAATAYLTWRCEPARPNSI